MQTRHRASVLLLVLLMLLPGLASAIRKGRLIGIVLDPEGNPIEGVTVTATSEEVAGFNEVEVTDKKGVFKLDFEEINVVYRYKFDKVGYQTLISEQTWKKDGTARHKFTMQPGEAALVGDLPASTKFGPAIEAFRAGAAAFAAKDYPAAVARFEEALGHDPDLRPAWAALSLAHLELAQYEAAAETAEKAIALGATDQTVLRTRWEAYRNLGDEAKTAEALAAAEEAGSLAEEAKRIFNEAVAFVKAEDHEAAFAKFQEASELDPSLQPALLGVATSGIRIERYAEAMDAAEALLADDPRNEQALRVRYNAALKRDDEDLIFDALSGLAPFEPELARKGLLNLALVAYDANDSALATDRFDRLLEIDPGQVDCHYYLGLLNVSADADKARRHFKRFLELAPDHEEAGNVRDFLEHLGTP
jgi:tetratricopeptide (TPR) repeat protein